MNNKKLPQSSAFESFRILGKRAQDLLQRTREELQKRQKEGIDPMPVAPLPPAESEPQMMVDLSTWSVARAALAVLAIVAGSWLVIQLQDAIILLLLGFFVSAIIDPSVRFLERLKVPRLLAVLIHYLAAVVIITSLMVSLVPLLGTQITEMVTKVTVAANAFVRDPTFVLPFLSAESNVRLHELLQTVLSDPSLNNFSFALQQLGQNLSSAAQGSLQFAFGLAGSALSFVAQMTVVLALACFIQLERESIRQWVRGMLPPSYRGYLDDKSQAIHVKIAQWARGQAILGLCIAVLVFVALSIVGLDYAVTLAVLAGLTEFIPYLGPLIAAGPAVLVALTQEGPQWALLVAVLFYLIQWLENNFLVPMVMQRAVGLSPVAVMFAMLVAVSFPETIHPILGILLAVPATTILAIFLEDLRRRRDLKRQQPQH
ncbi:MAG: AI-2E family transporter [Candidatus Peribacteraceae bacterium]|nr:AI-2E family transporter [Candidatus Peribacteraceae bacterium]